MASRLMLPSSFIRVDVENGGKFSVIETVTLFGIPKPSKKVILVDEKKIRLIAVGYSDANGVVTFSNLAHDNRPLLLIAFDPNDEYASPTVRRIATLDGLR